MRTLKYPEIKARERHAARAGQSRGEHPSNPAFLSLLQEEQESGSRVTARCGQEGQASRGMGEASLKAAAPGTGY